jgi:hypothetical protein
VGTEPLAYFLKFHFNFSKVPLPTRELNPIAKPARWPQASSLLSRTLNTLTLCRVPDTREIFCLLRPSSRVRRRADSGLATLGNHYALLAIADEMIE